MLKVLVIVLICSVILVGAWQFRNRLPFQPKKVRIQIVNEHSHYTLQWSPLRSQDDFLTFINQQSTSDISQVTIILTDQLQEYHLGWQTPDSGGKYIIYESYDTALADQSLTITIHIDPLAMDYAKYTDTQIAREAEWLVYRGVLSLDPALNEMGREIELEKILQARKPTIGNMFLLQSHETN